MDHYCTVRLKWDSTESEDERTIFPHTFVAFPNTFDEFVTVLKKIRQWYANSYADARARDPELAQSLSTDVLGGVGVEVTNHWGKSVEVAPGRDVWFVFCHGQPSKCYSDYPDIEGTRVFYLDGGHHTELGADMLVSEDECLRVLKVWLDTNVFPDEVGSFSEVAKDQ